MEHASLIGTVLGGQYRLESQLGAGAMGSVFMASDLRLHRSVAVKTLKPNLLEDKETAQQYLTRFEQEAVLAANLTHPNIVAVHNFGEEKGIYYLVMEYVPESKPLSARLDEVGPGRLPLGETRSYFMQAAAGLGAIHALGAIHRDIKLQNLLVFQSAEGPRLKILDFGVAQIPNSHLTATGIGVGTPGYFAPEYIQHIFGKGKIDHRVDFFALGITLYRTLTGVKPFRDDPDQAAAFRSVANDVPPSPLQLRPDLPPGWEQVTLRLLEKSPDRRYQSAAELYAELDRVDELGPYAAPVKAEMPAIPAVPEVDLPELSNAQSFGSEARKAEAGAESEQSIDPNLVVELAPKLEGAAASFAEALRNPPETRPSFSGLPIRIRLAIGAGASVLLVLVVAILISLAKEKPHEEAHAAIIEAQQAVVAPKDVTAADLLVDGKKARLEVLREETRPARLPVKTASQPQRPSAPAERRAPVVVLAAAAKDLPGASSGTGGDAPAKPRRIDPSSLVQYFDDEPAPTAAHAGKDKGYGIPTGALAQASLKVPLSNEAASTPAIALLPQGLAFDDVGQVLPAGTTLIGTASYSSTGAVPRVSIRFSKMVLPDRTEKDISAIAVMRDGSAGLVARVRKTDGRASANVAEAALDVVDNALSGTTGGSAASRFTNDSRNDAQALRDGNTTMSVPKGFQFQVQFTAPL